MVFIIILKQIIYILVVLNLPSEFSCANLIDMTIENENSFREKLLSRIDMKAFPYIPIKY